MQTPNSNYIFGAIPKKFTQHPNNGHPNEHTLFPLQLCEARGFVCELCCTKDCTKVIFPWELTKVTRCDKCGSCFHIECKNELECPRCARLQARRLSKDN